MQETCDVADYEGEIDEFSGMSHRAAGSEFNVNESTHWNKGVFKQKHT